ncbi:sporulation protein YtxC [Brevibacillus sp. GCM10020057]|uniref:sporulation protein YtxC n=1 Tax=Brevibacillus sp. GCM10020057 TaxID=3317327 RepID=UPI003630C11F
MQTFRVLLENVPAHCGTYRAILQEMTERVNTAPVRITYKEEEQDGYRLFCFQSWCEEEYDAQTIDWARAFVALSLAEWIMQVKEPEIVEEMATDLLCAEQLEDEWADILPYIQRMCHESESVCGEFPATTRKANLYRKAFAYLESERSINVLGFVRFRLQDHWNELFELVESGIDEYLEDKQYQEFVELLRYFISVQEIKQEVVHVVPSVDKPFYLYDKKGDRIWLDQLDAALGLDEQICRDEDYLVSALVTLAPESIILHMATDRPGLTQTIRSIFGSRLSICPSCPLCLADRRVLDVHNPFPL